MMGVVAWVGITVQKCFVIKALPIPRMGEEEKCRPARNLYNAAFRPVCLLWGYNRLHTKKAVSFT